MEFNMYVEKKRERRRRDRERQRAHARRVYKNYGYRDPALADRAANKNADHLALCSLSCCGNPRRWFGQVTLQEQRAIDELSAPDTAGEWDGY